MALSLPELMEMKSLLMNCEQAKINTYHIFGDGIYIREMHAEAGVVAVGRDHIKRNNNYITHGAIRILADGQPIDIKAPFFFVANEGTKACLFTEYTIWQNIYPTSCQSVERIGAENIRDYPTALLLEGTTEPDYAPMPFGRYSWQSVTTTDRTSIYATADIKSGETLGVCRIDNKETILGRYLRSSGDPSATIEGDMLIAIKDIHGQLGGSFGEEITV